MLMPHPRQEKSRGNNARVEFKKRARERAFVVSRRKGGLEELLVGGRWKRQGSVASRATQSRGQISVRQRTREAKGSSRMRATSSSNYKAMLAGDRGRELRKTQGTAAKKKVCGCDGWR